MSPAKVYISIAVDRSSLCDFVGIMDQRLDELHGAQIAWRGVACRDVLIVASSQRTDYVAITD
jgi:hypothetical protein